MMTGVFFIFVIIIICGGGFILFSRMADDEFGWFCACIWLILGLLIIIAVYDTFFVNHPVIEIRKSEWVCTKSTRNIATKMNNCTQYTRSN